MMAKSVDNVTKNESWMIYEKFYLIMLYRH